MLFPILITLYLFISTFIIHKKTKYLYYSFILFAILASVRAFKVGNDTPVYIDLFNTIKDIDFRNLIFFAGDRFEIGFIFYLKLLHYISDNPAVLLIVTAIIVYPIFVWFIRKYSNDYILSVLLFFYLGYYDTTLNIMRQIIAFAIIMIAFDAMMRHKWLSFILLVILAFLFHKSAMIFMLSPLAYLLINKKWLLNYTLIFAIIIYISSSAILVYTFNAGIIHDYYEGSEYFDKGKIAPIINCLMIFCIIIGEFFVRSKKKSLNMGFEQGNSLKSNAEELFLVLMIFGFLILIISIKFAILFRVAYYFTMFQIVLIPLIISNIKNKHNRQIIKRTVIGIAIIYYFVTIIYRPEWNNAFNYHFNSLLF